MGVIESPFFRIDGSDLLGAAQKRPELIIPDVIRGENLILEGNSVREVTASERINRAQFKTKPYTEPESGHLPTYMTNIQIRRKLERAAELGLRGCSPTPSHGGRHLR